MSEKKDILDEIRWLLAGVGDQTWGTYDHHQLYQCAADEIERLRAENTKLAGLLERSLTYLPVSAGVRPMIGDEVVAAIRARGGA